MRKLVESLGAQPLLAALPAGGLFRAGARRTRLVRVLKTGWHATLGSVGSNTVATLIAQAYLIALLWLGTGLVLDTGLTPGQLMSSLHLAGYP